MSPRRCAAIALLGACVLACLVPEVHAQGWMQMRPGNTHPVLFSDTTHIGVKDDAAPQRDLVVSGNLEVGDDDDEGSLTLENGHLLGTNDNGLRVSADRASLTFTSKTESHLLRTDALDIQVNIESTSGSAGVQLQAPNLNNNSCPVNECTYPNTQPWDDPASHTGNATTLIYMDEEGKLKITVSWPADTYVGGSAQAPDALLAGTTPTPFVLTETHAEILSLLSNTMSSFGESRCLIYCEAACKRFCNDDPQWAGHEASQVLGIESASGKPRSVDPALCANEVVTDANGHEHTPCEMDCRTRCATDDFEVMGLGQRRAAVITLKEDAVDFNPQYPNVDNAFGGGELTVQHSLYGSATFVIEALNTTTGNASLVLSSPLDASDEVRHFHVRSAYDGQFRVEETTVDSFGNVTSERATLFRVDHNHEFHFDTRAHFLSAVDIDGNLYVGPHCVSPHLPATECVSGWPITTATATASSSLSSFPPANTLDLSDATVWKSSTDTDFQWVQLDVRENGAGVELTKVVVQWHTSDTPDPAHPDTGGAEDYDVLVSEDGASWLLIESFRGAKCSSASRLDVISLSNLTVSHVLLNMTNRCGVDGTWQDEVAYYGIAEITLLREHSVLHSAFFVGGANNASTSAPTDYGDSYAARVGINTADPTHTLTVNGSALLEAREADETGFEGGTGHLDVGDRLTASASMRASVVQATTTSLVLASGDAGEGACFECVTGLDAQDDQLRSTNIVLDPQGDGVVLVHGDTPTIKGGDYFATGELLSTQLGRTQLELQLEAGYTNGSVRLVPAGAGVVHLDAINANPVGIDVEWPEDIPWGTAEYGIGGMWPGQGVGRFPDSFALDDQHLVLRAGPGEDVVVDGTASSVGLSIATWVAGNHPGLVVEDQVSPAVMSDWGKTLRLRTRSMNKDVLFTPHNQGVVVVGGNDPLVRAAVPAWGVSTPPASAYPENMTAHWTFDAQDLTDAVSAGAANGGVVFSGAAEFVEGRVGAFALRLDGNTTVRIDSSSGAFDSGTYTVAAWIRVRGNRGWLEQDGTLNEQQTVFGSWYSGVREYMRLGKQSTMRFSDSGGVVTQGGVSQGPPGIAAESGLLGVHKHQWYHVTSVRENGGTQKLYVDGTLVAQNTNNQPVEIGPNGNPMWIGSDDGSASLFSGDVDDICFWTRLLSDAEVHALYDVRNYEEETLSVYPHTRKNSLRLLSRSQEQATVSTFDIVVEHENPLIVSRQPLPLWVKTQSDNQNITLQPTGSGSLVLGRSSWVAEELFGFDPAYYAVLKSAGAITLAADSLITFSTTRALTLISDTPVLQSTAKTGLKLSGQISSSSTATTGSVYLQPVEPETGEPFHVEVGGDAPSLSSATELTAKGSAGDIEFNVPSGPASMLLIGGGETIEGEIVSPTLTSQDKDFELKTQDGSNADIVMAPNANGVLLVVSSVGAAVLSVLPTATAADLTLESGVVNGVAGTGSGSVVLVPGGTESVHTNPTSPPNGEYTEGKVVQIVRGRDTNSAAVRSQVGGALVLRTQSDNRDIQLLPNGNGRVLLESASVDENGLSGLPSRRAMEVVAVDELTLQGGSEALDDDSQLVLSATRLSLRSLSTAVQPAAAEVASEDDKDLVLATQGVDLAGVDIHLAPDADQGMVVVGGDVPMLVPEDASKPIEIKSGASEPLTLVYGSAANAVNIGEMDASGTAGSGRGTQSQLSSASGLDLQLVTRSDNADVVLGPDGAGLVKVAGEQGIVKAQGESALNVDLLLRTPAGSNANINLQPSDEGVVVVMTNTLSSAGNTNLTAQGRSANQGLKFVVADGDTHMVKVDRQGSSDPPVIGSLSHLTLMAMSGGASVVLDPYDKGYVVVGSSDVDSDQQIVSRPDSPTLTLMATDTDASSFDKDLVMSTPNGVVVLDVVAEGDPTLHPTVSSNAGQALHLRTRTSGKHIVFNPHGTGQLLVGSGGRNDDGVTYPTIRPASDSITFQKLSPSGSRNLRLVPAGAAGLVSIAADTPTIGPQDSPAKNLTLATIADTTTTHLRFLPTGSGQVWVGGDTPTVQAKAGSVLTLNATAGDITLNPGAGAVAIGGDQHTLMPAHGLPIAITTNNGGGNIRLVPNGLGQVVVGGVGEGVIDLDGSANATAAGPTLQSANAADSLQLQSGSGGNVVLAPGGSFVFVHSGTLSSTLQSGTGKELTVETLANDTDVILAPHGEGVVRVLGADAAHVVSDTGKVLQLLTEADEQRVVLKPHGDGKVFLNPTASNDSTVVASDVLQLRGLPATKWFYRNAREDGEYSAQSSSLRLKTDVLRLVAGEDAGSPRTVTVLQSQSGKDLTLSTQTAGMDIRLEPNAAGRVRVGGARTGSQSVTSSQIAAINKPLTIASGSIDAQHDLLLNYGKNYALVIETDATLTSAPDTDLVLQTRLVGGNVALNPAGTGRVVVGSSLTSAAVTTYPEGLDGSGNDFWILAGVDKVNEVPNPRNIHLNTEGVNQHTVLEGLSGVITSANDTTLVLEVECEYEADSVCSSTDNKDILLQPSGNGTVEIQGDNPTIQTSNANGITIATVSMSANIYLVPHGSGVVKIGGSQQVGIGGQVSQSNNTFSMQFRSTDHILQINPDKNVVIDTDTPIIQPRDGERITLATFSGDTDVYLAPNGTGTVVIGGDTQADGYGPTVQANVFRGLNTRDVQLTPTKTGLAIVDGVSPNVAATEGRSLTLATRSADGNIVLSPAGNGTITVGGDWPVLESKESTLQFFHASGRDDAPDLILRTGVVAIGGDTSTIESKDSLTIGTVSVDTASTELDIQLLMENDEGVLQDGLVIIDNENPTIEAHHPIDSTKVLRELWVRNDDGDVTLRHGDLETNYVITNTVAARLTEGSLATRFTLKTPSDDKNIVLHPHGTGKNVLGNTLQSAKAGQALHFDAGAGAATNVEMLPDGVGKLVVTKCSTCSDPELRAQGTSPLRLRAYSDAVEASVLVDADINIGSTNSTSGVVRAGVGTDLLVQGSADQDVILQPGSGGSVKIASLGERAVAMREGLWLQSSASKDLVLRTRVGRKVVFATSNLTADGSDLILRGNVVYLGQSGVDAGIELAGELVGQSSTSSGGDLYIKAGDDSTGTGRTYDVALDGSLTFTADALTTASSRSLFLHTLEQTDTSAFSFGKDISVVPGTRGVVVVGGGTPTISAASVDFTGSTTHLTVRSTASDAVAGVDLRLEPAGAGKVLVQPSSATASAAVYGASLALRGTSDTDAFHLDLAVGPEDDASEFSLVVLTDATNAVIAGNSTGVDAGWLRFVGIGSSPDLTLDSELVVVGSDQDVVVVHAAEDAPLALVTDGNADLELSPGSGAVVVGGDEQTIAGDGDLTVRGVVEAGSLALGLESLSSSADFVVEVAMSEVDGVEFGLASTSGRALTLATLTSGQSIDLEPAGLGAVVVDSVLQLPVLSEPPACASADDDGKMWLYNDAVQFCMGSAVRTMTAS